MSSSEGEEALANRDHRLRDPQNQVGRVSIDIPPPCQQPDTSVEDLEIAPHVPTRSPAECAQHMEECTNGLAFLKRYAEGSTEKKVRVLTCPSSYRLSHFLAMYTQDHLALP
jgi:hypothetical protein